jgi:hypothetical protein
MASVGLIVLFHAAGKALRCRWMAASSSSETLILVGQLPVSRTSCTVRPMLVVVAPIRSTITPWLTKGRPRQFMLMCANRRCSILFHLLVADGRL